ncbi:hypothetical protein BCR42DRAFT_220750 [Absidia repens]|uniref:Uncharacterized protein n=1 Tax=Absidia repens TaxID=90262 RepID=A0A1X2INL6_9FUNG|nr:hypothetical protein BCR42DRAFT_220750 [Absidia repens]
MYICASMTNMDDLNNLFNFIELTQASPSDKSKIKEMLHISQSHHHHHHHHHHHRDQLGNIKSTTVHHEPSELADIICNNDINSIKQGIRDILRRSKQDSEVAKKNHHMQLHPPPQGDNNDGNTASASHPPLDINNKQQ